LAHERTRANSTSANGDRPEPPYSVEAEQAVLGAMLLDAEALIHGLVTLAAEDFYRPAHRTIFTAISSLEAEGRHVDVITLSTTLGQAGLLDDIGGGPFLHTLIESVPTAAAVKDYATDVAETAALRQLIDLGFRITQLGYAGSGDAAARRGIAERWLSDLTRIGSGLSSDRATDGATFCLDVAVTVTPIWGSTDGREVIWPTGESLMLVGPQGVGKTTLAGQLTLARIGIPGHEQLLGFPVIPTTARVLYLACDRPQQIRRSFRRMVDEADRAILAERLVVWQGPPLQDLAKQPTLLSDLARQAGADTLIVDSLKDVTLDLAKDEGGAAYNRARQAALAQGIELVELHHQRKASSDGRKPKQLADVYGSVWLTAGAGSVLLLWGDAGDPVVEMVHLKQPVDEVGPCRLLHDAERGTTIVVQGADLLDLVRVKPGLTAVEAAKLLFDIDDRSPEPKEVEKARRKLDALVRRRLLICKDGIAGRPGGQAKPATYHPIVNTEPS